MKNDIGIIILAAGKGKRMGGVFPKVLFQLDGKPLIDYVVVTAQALDPALMVLVVGFEKEKIINHLSNISGITFAVQEKQLGTGHAVQQTSEIFRGFDGLVLLLYGDVPLISAETLRKLIEYHNESGNDATVLTADYQNPHGYGRIFRDVNGDLLCIIEEKDADESEKKIHEINTGMYVFNAPALYNHLFELKSNNIQKELYITDMIGLLREKGHSVGAYKTHTPSETYGVNTYEQLEELQKILKST